MSTAIFVHGTGVREPAFSKLFGRIQSQLRSRRPDLAVEPCYWGEAEGARLYCPSRALVQDTVRQLRTTWLRQSLIWLRW